MHRGGMRFPTQHPVAMTVVVRQAVVSICCGDTLYAMLDTEVRWSAVSQGTRRAPETRATPPSSSHALSGPLPSLGSQIATDAAIPLHGSALWRWEPCAPALVRYHGMVRRQRQPPLVLAPRQVRGEPLRAPCGAPMTLPLGQGISCDKAGGDGRTDRRVGPTRGNVRWTAIRVWRFPFDHAALALSRLFARF